MAAEININFASKGDEDVLEAVKKVSKHVGDLKKIASTPINLDIVKGSMATEDFNRLKTTIDSAKAATGELAKEQAKAAKIAAKAVADAHKEATKDAKYAAQDARRIATETAKAAREAERLEKAFAKVGGKGAKEASDMANQTRRVAEEAAHAAREAENLARAMSRAKPGTWGPNSQLTAQNFSTRAVDEVQKNLRNLNGQLDKTATTAKAAGFQLGFVSRIIAAMAIRSAVREVFSLADSFTQLQNKVKTVVGEDSVGFISERLYQVAQNSRTSLDSIVTAFSRTTRSVKSLGKSQNEVLAFTETLSKAIQVGGSTSIEASNAMIQLSQGMGSGALKGDELRSVLEQLPIVAELIADKMGVPISALRKLGSEGALTTEVIFDAVQSQTARINEMMSKMQLTVGQAWTMLKNKATMESQAMSGVMRGLANAIQFVTNNFDAFVTAALMFAGAGGMGLVVKGIQAATVATKALAAAWAATPWGLALTVAALAVGALTPLVAQLKVSSDATATYGDVWVATWDTIKERLEGKPEENIKEVDAAMEGLSESTKNWMTYLGKALDIISNIGPGGLIKAGYSAITGKDGFSVFENFASDVADRTNETASEEATNKLIQEGKDILGEDLANQEGDGTDIMVRQLDKEREALLAYEKIIREKEKKEKGDKPKGSTLDEALAAIREESDKLMLTDDSSDPGIASRIAIGLKETIKQMGDYGKNISVEQERIIENALEEKFILEDSLKLREQIQKSIEEQAKAERKALEDYSKEFERVQKEQKKLVEEFAESRAERETAFEATMTEIDPRMSMEKKLADLQRFATFAESHGMDQWASRAKGEIDQLTLAIITGGDHLKNFADQLTGIFGPGGVLVKGFADATANAIVMSSSLGDLRRAIVEVLNSVQKQALSSLIQLPLNMAMGALTNSLMGPTPGVTTGVRQVGAAEAKSWGFASGGYTGNGGVNEIAGAVHGQEYVLNAEATRRFGKENLDTINKGGAIVGSQAPGVKVVVNNHAGAQVETREVSPGQIEVMITKAIKEQAGRVIAGQMGDANSTVSRSLQKNFETGRRRS